MLDILKSTIGRKQLIAVAGLGLALFVFTHMAGNMLILVSPEAYNMYGHKLITNPLIYFAEVGLVGIFLLHVILAVILSIKNRASRTQRYGRAPKEKAKSSLFARTMFFQGIVIFVFVILHLITFKYGKIYWVEYNGEKIRDLHRLVVEVFQEPGYVVWYIISLLLLFGHLAHGFSSTFQTLGINRVKYDNKIKTLGLVYGAVVVAGFISQPLYVYFIYKG